MKPERETTEHICAALTAWDVSANIIASLKIDSPGVLILNDQVFATYAYFDGIEQPLFEFRAKQYRQQSYHITEDERIFADFKLSLSSKQLPIFEIKGDMATVELYHRLKEMTCYEEGSPEYDLLKSSGAFFDGGFDNPRGKHFLIEFWNPEGAQQFIDHLNRTYELTLTCDA